MPAQPPPEPDSLQFEYEQDVAAAVTPADRALSPADGGPAAPPGHRPSMPGLPAILAGLLFAPCVAALLWLALPAVFRVESALDFPYQMDAEEGFLLQQALDLNSGRSIYTPVDREPYLVGNYPPAYPMLVAGALRLDLEGLRAGRAVVAVSTVLCVLLLFATARLVSGRWFVSLLAPLLFVVSYEFYNWVAFARVDLPALAFTLLGVFLFLASAGRGVLVISALCFAVAAFTRQTAILAPAACAAVLLWRDRRGLAWFLVPYLGVGLGSFLALNFALEGELWRHLVEYNRNAMDWGVLRSILKNEIWFFYRWWIAGIAVGTIAVAVLRARGGDGNIASGQASGPSGRRMPFVLGYFILAALSLSAFAKSGSAPNYALEPLAAAALLLVALLGRVFEALGAASTSRRGAGWTATILVAACLTAHVGRLLPIAWREMLPGAAAGVGDYLDGRRIGWALFSSPNPDAQETARGDLIVEELRRNPGEVLSELPIFAIEAGRPVLFQPFIMSTLAREGRWDEGVFVEDLRRGRFSIIVSTQDFRAVRTGAVLARYTPQMAEAILEAYEPAGAIAPGALGLTYYLWRPRDAAQDQGAAVHSG